MRQLWPIRQEFIFIFKDKKRCLLVNPESRHLCRLTEFTMKSRLFWLLVSLGVVINLAPEIQGAIAAPDASAQSLHSSLPRPALLARQRAHSSRGLRQLALQLVNRDRQRRGLSTLNSNALLDQVAQQHAEDMIRRGYFSHYTPEGFSPTQRVRQAGGQITAGENIMNYRSGSTIPQAQTLVTEFQDGFMDSPGHRQMILKSDFAQFGFGIASTPDKSRIVAVQLFGMP